MQHIMTCKLKGRVGRDDGEKVPGPRGTLEGRRGGGEGDIVENNMQRKTRQ